MIYYQLPPQSGYSICLPLYFTKTIFCNVQPNTIYVTLVDGLSWILT